MSDEAKAALAQRESMRAEYDEEFDVDDGEAPDAAITVADIQDMLAPSMPQQTRRIVQGIMARAQELKREMAEMSSRESSILESNRVSHAHNKKLAEERDYWRDLKDPQQTFRALTEENGKLRVQLADALEQLDKLKAMRTELVVDRMPAPRPWWRFWGRA